VTSKLQLTVPQAIADQYGIRPGDEVEWIQPGLTPICGPTLSITDSTGLFSEDFEHNRLYGTVRAVNPFIQPPV